MGPYLQINGNFKTIKSKLFKFKQKVGRKHFKNIYIQMKHDMKINAKAMQKQSQNKSLRHTRDANVLSINKRVKVFVDMYD